MMLLSRGKKNFKIQDFIAETAGSVIFTLMQFMFISRYLSDEFHFSFLVLSLSVGLAYFAGVYIPFHTYKVHIIPFITIFYVFRRKNWSMLWQKIPFQILGALLGVLLFKLLNQNTTAIDLELIQSRKLGGPYVLGLVNALCTGLLCASFFIVRVIFKAKRFMGTFLLGVSVSVLYYFSGNIENLSYLNPFGYYFFNIFNPDYSSDFSFFESLLIHFLFPIVAIYLIYQFANYYLKAIGMNSKSAHKVDANKTSDLKTQ